MSRWFLYDYRKAAEKLDDFPRWEVTSEKQLHGLLKSNQTDEYGVFILRGPGEAHLRIGMGSGLGFLYWVTDQFAGPALADREYAQEDDFFLFEGVQEEIPRSQLLPSGRVVEEAIVFYRTGRRPTAVGWKLWDEKAKIWQMVPPGASAE